MMPLPVPSVLRARSHNQTLQEQNRNEIALMVVPPLAHLDHLERRVLEKAEADGAGGASKLGANSSAFV